jgi:hypothetical protein
MYVAKLFFNVVLAFTNFLLVSYASTYKSRDSGFTALVGVPGAELRVLDAKFWLKYTLAIVP